MTTPWRKALRDFRLEGPRTVLVVLAVALGISAFATVLSTYAILTRELNDGYLATNPASATLWTDAVDDELLRTLAADPDIREAEARRAVRGRIRAGPAEWRNLQLFVVKDYGQIRVSILEPQQGAWPPAPGEILVERDALQVARARIGDTVRVKTANGPERSLRLTGTVHDVGQAQARMENMVYGYIVLDTLAELGEEPYLDQLKIRVAGDANDEAHVRRVAAATRQRLEGLGHPVRRMETPKPGEHPHAAIMGLLLLAQAAFGLFALALSGILVVNLLTALMAAQVRQIGVMKAVGGTRRQVASIYLGQALLLGVAALALAVPAGMGGSRVFCRYLAVFLNFDVTSFAVPWWVYGLEAAVGLLVPLLAAAHPVARGSGVSVHEALVDFGAGRKSFGTSAFDRFLARRRGLGRPLLMALRNIFRRRARLALTLSTLAVAGLFFMSALNTRASLIRTLDRFFETRRYDLTVTLGAMAPFETTLRAVRRTPGVREAEGWIVTEGTLPVPGEAMSPPAAGGPHGAGRPALPHGGAPLGDRFSLVALPPETVLLRPNIVEGRGLRADDTNAVVANSALAAKGLAVGREVTVRLGNAEVQLRVVGRAHEPFVAGATAYVPRGFVEGRGGLSGMTNSIRLALEETDRATLARVKASLEEQLEQEGIRAVGSSSQADSRFGFDQHMVMIYVFLIVMSAIMVGVGALGLMTTMSLNVLERRREMGVMRAIGASPGVVWRIVVAEGAIIGLASWLLAVLAAWPVSRLVGDLIVKAMFRTGLDHVVDPLGPLAWLVVSVVFGAVASFLPAWHASRGSVREAIGYE